MVNSFKVNCLLLGETVSLTSSCVSVWLAASKCDVPREYECVYVTDTCLGGALKLYDNFRCEQALNSILVCDVIDSTAFLCSMMLVLLCSPVGAEPGTACLYPDILADQH